MIVDEVHTCVAAAGLAGSGSYPRYDLIPGVGRRSRRHLMLVSATPHSGKDEAFRNLIQLLDKTFVLDELDSPEDREQLARHFVQRRRSDIRVFLDQETPFPKDRESREVPYRLSPAYRELFDQVLDYARETVRTGDGGAGQAGQVVVCAGVAACAGLLTAGGGATLRTRAAASKPGRAEADGLGRAAVLDLPDEET